MAIKINNQKENAVRKRRRCSNLQQEAKRSAMSPPAIKRQMFLQATDASGGEKKPQRREKLSLGGKERHIHCRARCGSA